MTFHLDHADEVQLAEIIRNGLTGPAPVYCRNKFWQYADGVWSPDNGGKGDFSRTIYEKLKGLSGTQVGDRSKLSIGARTVAGVRTLLATDFQDAKFFDHAPPGVCVQNGFIRLDAETAAPVLLPPSPDHRARFMAPAAYDPTAQCPRLLAMMADMRLRPGEVAAIQEFFGVALFGKGPGMQRYLLLFGNGENGRSSLTDAFVPLFEAPISLAPSECTGFNLAKFDGPRLNLVDEMPSKMFQDETNTVLKKITTGGAITAGDKNEKAYTFIPQVSQVFLPNNPLVTNDLTHAFWRRPLVVGFTRRFTTVDRVRDIGKIIAKAEGPGILAWLVAGASAALGRNAYTTPESHTELRAEWEKNCDPVSLFLEELFDLQAKEADCTPIAAKDLYALYADRHFGWCETTGRGKYVMNSTAFGLRLKALGIPSKRSDGIKYILRQRGPAAAAGPKEIPGTFLLRAS